MLFNLTYADKKNLSLTQAWNTLRNWSPKVGFSSFPTPATTFLVRNKNLCVCYIMCFFHADPGALYKSRIKCLGMRMLASLATELAVGGQELIRAYSTSCESCYLRTNTLRLVFAPRTGKGHMGCTITWLFTLRMPFYPLPRSATALFYPHATKHM